MVISSRKQVIVFIFAVGFLFYLASALWSAFFIVSLPQDKAWCKRWAQYEVEGRFESKSVDECVEFKNTLEALKYDHNKKMYERNRYWVYGELAAGILLAFFVFHVIPRWRGSSLTLSGAMNGGPILLGIATAILMPLLLGWILPAPEKWFPQEIKEIADLRVREELDILRDVARAWKVSGYEKAMERIQNKLESNSPLTKRDFSSMNEAMERMITELQRQKPSGKAPHREEPDNPG